MKKIKYSVVEKKLIRNIFIAALIQVLIIVSFVRLFNASQPVDISDTKQVEIIVEEVYYRTRTRLEDWLIVSDNSTKYILANPGIFPEYTVSELYELISVGDRLFLRYYETFNIFGKTNYFVVDARTETETYRTLEEYNNSKQGVDIAVIVIFSVFELLFCAGTFIYFALDKNTIKSIYRKVKKVKKK